jgi:cysteine desulfuration protein SufE
MKISERQNSLVEDLLFLPTPQERLAALGHYAEPLRIYDLSSFNAEEQVQGCQSVVYVRGVKGENGIEFQYGTDSVMVGHLVGILCYVYSGSSVREVTDVEPDFWEQSGLNKVISQTRQLGLVQALKQMRAMALQLQ